MQTLKIKYHAPAEDIETINRYRHQYSNLLHCAYNRAVEDPTEKSVTDKVNALNHIELLDSFFVRSTVKEAISLVRAGDKDEPGTKLVFGGKKNLIDRCQGKITREEYRHRRLSPIYSIGEANQKGNRKFQILPGCGSFLFKPNKDTHIILEVTGRYKSYRTILERLYGLQEAKQTPISYKLDDEYIYLSFDETAVNQAKQGKQITDRVFAIDLNPNYVGWSVVDWKSSSEFKVVASGVISTKPLNDKEFSLKKSKKNPTGYSSDHPKRIHLNNKRVHEVYEISKYLVNIARHYQCSLFVTEDLSIKSSDKGKGKRFNSLCNKMWNREKLVQNLEKRCNIYQIAFQKAKANYSSFVGNFLFRGLQLPDMVLASIEIGRRGYEYNHQYILKTKPIKKNIVFPDTEDFATCYTKSLEEFGVSGEVQGLKEVYELLKKSKCRYRLSLEDLPIGFSSCFSSAGLVLKTVL